MGDHERHHHGAGSWQMQPRWSTREAAVRWGPQHARKRTQTRLFLPPTSGILVGPVACGVLLQLLFVNQQNLPCGRGWIRETKTSFASKLKKLLRNTTWTGREIKCKIEPSCHRSVTSCSVDDFCCKGLWEAMSTYGEARRPNWPIFYLVQGFLCMQGKFKIKSSGNHWPRYFSYPRAMFREAK